MLVPRRHSTDDYRYGFQGQEKDDEIKGDKGNSLNYTFRMHDPRVGRFFARDPIAHKFPYNSPYAFGENRVIDGIELEGLEVTPYQEKIKLKPVFVEDAGSVSDRVANAAHNGTAFLTNVTVIPAYNASSGVINGLYNLFTGKYNQVTLPDLLQDAQYSLDKGVRKQLDYYQNTSAKNIFNNEINALFTLENYEIGAELIIFHKASGIMSKGSKGFVTENALKPGSGPVAGVLEVSNLRKSVAQFKNYNPKSAVEFVFDPKTETFVVGKPRTSIKGLSPHQNLGKSIGADNNIVGGMFKRGANGEILTNELSGHYYKNWTPEIRTKFTEFLESSTGQEVLHSSGPTF